MAAKLILDTEAISEDFFKDSYLVGIVSAEEGYRLCWLINNYFNIDFVRDPETTITYEKKSENYFFPVYVYQVPCSSKTYYIYKLKCSKESLLPEVKQLDYIWMVRDAESDEEARIINSGLKSIQEVEFSSILELSQLTSLNNLVL